MNNTNQSSGGRPTINMDRPTRDKFKASVGCKVNEVKVISVGATAGAVAGTDLVPAGVVAGVALSPVIPAETAVGAIGAGITKIFGWW